MKFLSFPIGAMKRFSSFLYNVYTEPCFVLNASRFGLPVPLCQSGPLTEIYQTSASIAKSDDSLRGSDHFVLPTNPLPEYEIFKPFELLDDLPLSSDDTAFTDLFTESESSQDSGNMV